MGIGVIADEMSFLINPLHQFRIGRRVFPHHEKTGVDAPRFQTVQEPGRIYRMRAVVKGQGNAHLFFVINRIVCVVLPYALFLLAGRIRYFVFCNTCDTCYHYFLLLLAAHPQKQSCCCRKEHYGPFLFPHFHFFFHVRSTFLPRLTVPCTRHSHIHIYPCPPYLHSVLFAPAKA